MSVLTPTPRGVSRDAQRKRDTDFVRALTSLVNRHSRENGSDTPDFLLAEYLMSCLKTYEAATTARDKWYGYGGMKGVNTAPPVGHTDDEIPTCTVGETIL